MAYTESILSKSKRYLVYGFTGIVVVSTLYNMFISSPPSFDVDDKKKKKKRHVHKEDIDSYQKKSVKDWSRRELFLFLAKNKIYPDIDATTEELQSQVTKLEAESDHQKTEDIVLEASL